MEAMIKRNQFDQPQIILPRKSAAIPAAGIYVISPNNHRKLIFFLFTKPKELRHLLDGVRATSKMTSWDRVGPV